MKKLRTLISSRGITFGDYILFQKFTRSDKDQYKVSKPILAIYLGIFPCDQTIGFKYLRWVNENHQYISETGHKLWKEVGNVEEHIEWDDYIDILGFWKTKPTFKDILLSYRDYYKDDTITSVEIDWS